MALTQYFRWDDPDLSAFGNTAGALITVFDKILVNGYNSKTVTLSRIGSTVTASCTAHGFLDRHVLAISGADQAEYNLPLTRISVVDANTFTFQVSGSPATPATGTITAKIAPLGWSIAHTGTNTRSYQRPGSSRGFFLGVDDTNAASARLRLFETMTGAGVAAASGTNPTPSDTQLSGGLYLYKANGSPRQWVATGNATSLNFLNASTSDFSSLVNALQGVFVWDALESDAGVHDVFISASHSVSQTTVWAGDSQQHSATLSGTSPSGSTCYALRSPSLAASSAAGLTAAGGQGAGASSAGVGLQTVFDYTTFGLRTAPVSAYVRDGKKRSQIPGVYAPLNGLVFSALDTFRSAAGSDIGERDFLVIGGTASAWFFFDLSDDWVIDG